MAIARRNLKREMSWYKMGGVVVTIVEKGSPLPDNIFVHGDKQGSYNILKFDFQYNGRQNKYTMAIGVKANSRKIPPKNAETLRALCASLRQMNLSHKAQLVENHFFRTKKK